MTPPFLFVLITLPPTVPYFGDIDSIAYAADAGSLTAVFPRGFVKQLYSPTLRESADVLWRKAHDEPQGIVETDGTFCVCATGLKPATVYDAGGRSCGTIPAPLRDGDICRPIFSGFGHRVAVQYYRGHGSPYDDAAKLIVWDCAARKAVGQLSIENPPGGAVASAFAFNRDGTLIAGMIRPAPSFNGSGTELGVWEVATGRRLATRHIAEDDNFGLALKFIGPERVLLDASLLKRPGIWKWRTNVFERLGRVDDSWWPLAVDPYGRWACAPTKIAHEWRLVVFDVNTFEERFVASGVSRIGSAAAVHPSGRSYIAHTKYGLETFPAYPRGRSFTADQAWAGLAADAPTAAAVIGFCLENERFTLDLLDARLKPASPAPLTAAELHKLIVDLDAPQFATREAGIKKLKEYPRTAEAMARETLKTTKSTEQRAKLEAVVAAAGKLTPNDLRGVRCVEILERLDHPAAKPFLTKLAAGHPADPLTKAAKGE